jgi:hypothetical protein
MTAPLPPTNPDLDALNNKNIINISYYASDVSASFGGVITSSSIQTNITEQKIILMSIPDGYNTGSFIVRSLYYTPVYEEQINYNEWKKLDRTFLELTTI